MRHASLPIAALSLVLLGAGCAPWNWGVESRSTPRPIPAPAPAPKETTSTFSDEELGLAFTYPSAWGEVMLEEENGSDNGVPSDCVYMRTVRFTALESGTLIAAVATDACDPPARGGWWADQANGYVEDLAYLADCETGSASTCDAYTNNAGETVWRWHYDSFERPFGEPPLTDVTEFGMYHAGHPLAGIAISTQPLIEGGESQWKNELTDLVRSISFVE